MSLLSPAEVAKEIRLSGDRILAFIGSGELRAFNVSKGNQRPRWRISRDDLDAFLNRRANKKDLSAKREIAKPRKRHF